jgi:hypothetical protein
MIIKWWFQDNDRDGDDSVMVILNDGNDDY